MDMPAEVEIARQGSVHRLSKVLDVKPQGTADILILEENVQATSEAPDGLQDAQETVTEAPQYEHPTGNREYLQELLVPLLQEGLYELMHEVQLDRLQICEGHKLTVDGYLMHGWRPFNALKWLGDWLYRHNPNAPIAQEVGLQSGDWVALSREEKLQVAFQHLDYKKDGILDTDELLPLTGRLRRLDEEVSEAARLHWEMDADEDGLVLPHEFVQFMLKKYDHLDGEAFDLEAQRLSQCWNFSLLDGRESKLQHVFRELEIASEHGCLSGADLLALIKHTNPEATDVHLPTIVSLDSKGKVSESVFVSSMMQLLEGFTDDNDINSKLNALLDTATCRTEASSQENEVDDIRPKAYAEFVKSLPTYKQAQHLSSSQIAALTEPVLYVDVRSDQEWAISHIPGAVHVELRRVHDDPVEYELRDGPGLTELLQRVRGTKLLQVPAPVTEPRAPGSSHNSNKNNPPTVVAYCSCGKAGGIAALLLTDLLGQPVFNLWGGVINHYNLGGDVVEANQQAIQALHPGSWQLAGFIRRPNIFRLSRHAKPPSLVT